MLILSVFSSSWRLKGFSVLFLNIFICQYVGSKVIDNVHSIFLGSILLLETRKTEIEIDSILHFHLKCCPIKSYILSDRKRVNFSHFFQISAICRNGTLRLWKKTFDDYSRVPNTSRVWNNGIGRKIFSKSIVVGDGINVLDGKFTQNW